MRACACACALARSVWYACVCMRLRAMVRHLDCPSVIQHVRVGVCVRVGVMCSNITKPFSELEVALWAEGKVTADVFIGMKEEEEGKRKKKKREEGGAPQEQNRKVKWRLRRKRKERWGRGEEQELKVRRQRERGSRLGVERQEKIFLHLMKAISLFPGKFSIDLPQLGDQQPLVKCM